MIVFCSYAELLLHGHTQSRCLKANRARKTISLTNKIALKVTVLFSYQPAITETCAFTLYKENLSQKTT